MIEFFFSGSISIKDWSSVLSEVLNITLPWRHVQPMLTEMDKKKKVIYDTTFDEMITFANQQVGKLVSNLEMKGTKRMIIINGLFIS